MTTTIATLPRITASTLSSLVLAHSPSVAIIDVRDDDHIGGHILGSTHVPSQAFDHKIPELVGNLQDKDTVVFHCALSQQRGPAAALRYIRERERFLGSAMTQKSKLMDTNEESESEKKKREGHGNDEKENEKITQSVKEQKVYVLDRGFVGWQERFGQDERLTEGYRKELWKDGYWM